MPEEQKKDIWDKASAVSGLTASILIPLVVAFVGNVMVGRFARFPILPPALEVLVDVHPSLADNDSSSACKLCLAVPANSA